MIEDIELEEELKRTEPIEKEQLSEPKKKLSDSEAFIKCFCEKVGGNNE